MSDEIKDFETVTPTLTFDPFEAVSYTHLDVYKRQGNGRLSGKKGVQ